VLSVFVAAVASFKALEGSGADIDRWPTLAPEPEDRESVTSRIGIRGLGLFNDAGSLQVLTHRGFESSGPVSVQHEPIRFAHPQQPIGECIDPGERFVHALTA
jgi:hypothetical protein